MKDTELRGIVLQTFYNKRREGWLIVPNGVEFSSLDDPSDVPRICDQLNEHGLIEWAGQPNEIGITSCGSGKISAHGVDVIEGQRTSAISITLNQGTHTHNTGGVQIVNSTIHGNVDLGKLISAIDHSQASEAEKKEAKSLLAKLLENPLVKAVGGEAMKILVSSAGVLLP